MVNEKKIRIVVKIGSNLITENNNILNYDVMEDLCDQISSIHTSGHQVIIVSSGAVAAGLQYISSFDNKITISNSSIIQKQILASIGQPILMSAYEKCFSKNNKAISQALLSKDDIENRLGYLNIRNTLNQLLNLGIIPIVNENDVVSTHELINRAYGDNDRLSAMVSNVIDSDILILLGSIDAVSYTHLTLPTTPYV